MTLTPHQSAWLARVMARTVSRPGPLPTPCLEWTGAVRKDYYGLGGGYPLYRDHTGKSRILHRAVAELYYGLLPKVDGGGRKMVVMHRCNNRRCLNIDHLKVGTQQENMIQARREKRVGPDKMYLLAARMIELLQETAPTDQRVVQLVEDYYSLKSDIAERKRRGYGCKKIPKSVEPERNEDPHIFSQPVGVTPTPTHPQLVLIQ